MKRQNACSDEIIQPFFMPGAEIFGKDNILQGINKPWHTFGISGTVPTLSVFNIVDLLVD
ncbi:MAG: hypothetical protein HKP58_16805 [Desulfatitalea sp.]|nr:hypothetical protein [Desulfatitalea sp.]